MIRPIRRPRSTGANHTLRRGPAPPQRWVMPATDGSGEGDGRADLTQAIWLPFDLMFTPKYSLRAAIAVETYSLARTLT
jgi:hypothetical protein